MFKQFNEENQNLYEFIANKNYVKNQSNLTRLHFISASSHTLSASYYHFARINFYLSGSELADEDSRFNRVVTVGDKKQQSGIFLNKFYQTGSLQTFDLVCELFAYGDEKIDTGIEEIDDIETQQSFVRTFELASSPAVSGTFQVGETVTGGTSSTTGEVAKWDATTRYLYLINMTGNFTVGEILTGSTSTATGTYEVKRTTDQAVETLAQIDAGITDTATSNKQIESDADSILDFSEGNPFSEGTNY